MVLRDLVTVNPCRMCFRLSLFLLLISGLMPQFAAAQEEERDSYKLKAETFWFYSHPTGAVYGTNRNGSFDLQGDIGFNTYSTFFGRFDWKFTHKNHLIFVVAPFDQTKTVALQRTIVFQGQTFTAGLTATGELKANAFAVGYQYDFIRRLWGHIGLSGQINFYDTAATISALAQTSGGVTHPAVRASGSLLAPIPVAGPDVRVYLLPRLFVTGNLQGMYLFGYGDYISTVGTVGVPIIKNRLSARAGYALASNLHVNTSSDRIGLTLTQKGALAGLEFSF
jgi:hypothetical protein